MNRREDLVGMTEQSVNDDRSNRVMCENIASTVLDLFVDEFLVEANLSDDGVLDALRNSELPRDFKGGNKDKFLHQIRKIAEDWLTGIERDHWHQARKKPFDRILVHRFSHLFPPTESLDDPSAVSRRALLGLMHAFEMMAGAEFLGQCQEAGRAIFKSLKDEHGGELSWKDFYESQGANDLADDLLVIIAWDSKNPGERLKWLRDLDQPQSLAARGLRFRGRRRRQVDPCRGRTPRGPARVVPRIQAQAGRRRERAPDPDALRPEGAQNG